MCSIPSQARWCLTGTPVQNSLDDLGALIKFLRMPIFNETATFRKHATKLHYSKGATNGEFRNLQLILSSICLRRNKTVLPNQEHTKFETVQPAFTEKERRGYRGLELACRRAITIGSKSLGDGKTHQMVMEALLRLRMFCNNGLVDPESTVLPALKPSAHPDEMLSLLQQSSEALCAYCSVDILTIGSSSDPSSSCLTQCGRVVCGECYRDQYCSSHRKGELFVCPLCHAEHDADSLKDGDTATQGASEKQWPSKIEAVVKNIQTHYFGSKW